LTQANAQTPAMKMKDTSNSTKRFFIAPPPGSYP
jgi:hypothetical protein